jgi:3-oxocholest-4-en-26-oyl-CoA dehydrogenase alpha subunit
VPAANLVGEENQGWGLITNQLNHERVTLCSSGIVVRQLAEVRRWARATKLADGRRVIDQEWVQQNLARVHARLEFLRLINWKVAWGRAGHGPRPPAASAVKVFGTEFYLEAYRLLMEVLGPAPSLRPTRPTPCCGVASAPCLRSMHILTFGGGTNELQRDLIAMFGLGLPPSPR